MIPLSELLTKIQQILNNTDTSEQKFQDILLEMVNDNIEKYNYILFILKH